MITDLIEEDIEEVILLSDKLIGERYITYNTFRDYISNPDKILKVYKLNNKIIGFTKGRKLSKADLCNSLLITDDDINNELTGDGNAGFLETICVENEYRGTEVTQRLADEWLHSLEKLGNIDLFCSTLWKTKYGTNAKRIIENLGFQKISIVEDYWYNDSIEKNYSCPMCGKPPCRCSMVFYLLKS